MNQTNSQMGTQSQRLRCLVRIALVTAVICVVAPFTLPIGPIPISLANLMILLAVYVLGWREALVSVLLYLLIGAIGLPVFSNGGAGLGKLVGPTGGFLLGYLALVLVFGLLSAPGHRQDKPLIRLCFDVLGMLVGTAALYTLGSLWFMHLLGKDLSTTLSLCVIPFLPLDICKIILAALVGPALSRRLAPLR